MSTSKEYLNYVLDLLSELDEITYRAMMGEYIIYYRGRIAGGIYDNRLLIKPVETAKKLMPEASFEIPYKGAKEMILIEEENKTVLRELFEAIYEELPVPKPRKKKTNL
ncbi:MAG: competence protein TfoX [Oscillospiraceae bacterium]|jgi:TfoX/Sxy family transcriptional regulator of competence genes|nr:competence protein TfoX [Oscillospiraceae bacterium]